MPYKVVVIAADLDLDLNQFFTPGLVTTRPSPIFVRNFTVLSCQQHEFNRPQSHVYIVLLLSK